MQTEPDIPWMEVLADNFLKAGGMPAYQLDTIAERYPLTLHSVGLSIGGCEPLDLGYLADLKELKNRSNAVWLSDHLCFTHVRSHYSHDLLPLPYTEEALSHVVERIKMVQDYLGEAILIENVSSYIDYKESELSEAEFLRAVVLGANCKVLLDVNNIYVSQANRGLNASEYLRHVPWENVGEIHLAGFDDKQGFLIDAHNNPVSKSVWKLFREVLQHLPDVPATVEWDNDLPTLEVLVDEKNKAELIRQEVQHAKKLPADHLNLSIPEVLA